MTRDQSLIRAGGTVRAAMSAIDHADTYEAIVEAAAAYTTAFANLRAMQATIDTRAAAVSERAGKFNAIRKAIR